MSQSLRWPGPGKSWAACLLFPVAAVVVLHALPDGGRADGGQAQRNVLLLDGSWSVEEGVAPEAIPATYSRTVAVPGLTNQARPVFPDVEQYETHEYVYTMRRYGVLPPSEKCDGLGRTRQTRNYFWYARTFPAPARRDHATLVVNKAQFGTAVWLNGKKVGEHLGCFTAGRFDVTTALNWSGDNRLVIRIGAHPGAMPDWAFWGSDGEKGPWTPGIYDRVELLLVDNPVIESVQVAPRIAAGEVLVQTRIRNHADARTVDLIQQVTTWRDGHVIGHPVRQQVRLAAGEETTVTQSVEVPHAVLWEPDNPFLYLLETSTGGNARSTRFGMREFHFDPATRQAILNGNVCYLRGSSLTLHRFFGDPKCGGLPWDEAWVRKFLVEIPHRMHWNAFRLCIGPPPQQWLDIADEAGLLLQYEFPIWSDREPLRHKLWKEDEIERQLGDFMRESWNHPSVVI
jgi:beta-galactosidase